MARSVLTTSIPTGDDQGFRAYTAAESALVKIYNTRADSRTYVGSGFIYEERGRIVTNYHVVRRAQRLEVVHLKYGTSYPNLYVLDVDPVRDIALLRIHDFKGFRYSDGRQDPDGKPLRRKPGSADRQMLPKGYEILALTNPGNLLGIFTDGIVGGHENILNIIPDRRSVLTAEESYRVLLFTCKTARGSSGGVLLDPETGEAAGVAVGATENEFIGFGLPIGYVNDLIERLGTNLGIPFRLYKWSEAAEYPNDPYYSESRYGSLYELGAVEIGRIRGIVTSGSYPISDAAVHVRTVRNDGSGIRLLPLNTDKKGAFTVQLPNLTHLTWVVRIEHPRYTTTEVQLSADAAGLAQHYPLSLRPEYVRSGATVIFRVRPNLLGLRYGSEHAYLESFVREHRRKRTKVLKWKLESTAVDPWLALEPTEGLAHTDGATVTLTYVAGRSVSDEVTPKFQQLAFHGSSGDLASPLYAFLEVFADTIPDDVIRIGGRVTTQEGGVPEDIVYFRLFGNGKLLLRDELESSGYFSIPVPPGYQGNQLRLEFEGDVFTSEPNHPELSNLDRNRELIVKLVPKPLIQ